MKYLIDIIDTTGEPNIIEQIMSNQENCKKNSSCLSSDSDVLSVRTYIPAGKRGSYYNFEKESHNILKELGLNIPSSIKIKIHETGKNT